MARTRIAKIAGLLALLFLASLRGAAAADGDQPGLNLILSAIPLYFDNRGSGDPDRAILTMQSGCGLFDLYLFVANQKDGYDWRAGPTVVKKEVAEPGPYCYQAILKAGPKGALQINLKNDWHPPMSSETLTIVYRDKQFLIGGYSSRVSSFTGPEDADKPEHISVCEINFLTGKGLRDGKKMKSVPPAPKLEDWSEDVIVPLCES